MLSLTNMSPINSFRAWGPLYSGMPCLARQGRLSVRPKIIFNILIIITKLPDIRLGLRNCEPDNGTPGDTQENGSKSYVKTSHCKILSGSWTICIWRINIQNANKQTKHQKQTNRYMIIYFDLINSYSRREEHRYSWWKSFLIESASYHLGSSRVLITFNTPLTRTLSPAYSWVS